MEEGSATNIYERSRHDAKTCRSNGSTETLALGLLVTATLTAVAQPVATRCPRLQTNYAPLKMQTTTNPGQMTKITHPTRWVRQTVGIPPVVTDSSDKVIQIPQFPMKTLRMMKILHRVITTRTVIAGRWTSKQILMKLDQMGVMSHSDWQNFSTYLVNSTLSSRPHAGSFQSYYRFSLNSSRGPHCVGCESPKRRQIRFHQ